MKRVSLMILSLALIGMFLFAHAEAATSQGLEWGLEVGDQYNYDYVVTDINNETLMEEVIHFFVTTIPSIPDIMNSWNELPIIEVDITWANGTLMEEIILEYLLYTMNVEFVLPIGNWTFLTYLYEETAHFDATISDNSSYWGFEGILFLFGETTVHVDYLKDDGLMAHFTMNRHNGSLRVTRQGLSGGILDLITDNILYIGAVVVVLAVVCIYYTKKK